VADALREAEEGLAMVDHHHWQLDGSAPELYQKYLVPAITTKWAEDIIERTQPQPGEDVLDVACGTGVVARLAGKRMGQGHVTGLDLNTGMLAVARTLPSAGPPIDWIEGSALDLPFPAAKFDLVLCQLGLQFFPDQRRALLEMRRVLVPTGRVALSVYSPIDRTPGANAFVLALDRVLGPTASRIKRGEHSFNSPDELQKLLIDAVLRRSRSPHRGANDCISHRARLREVPASCNAYGGPSERSRRGRPSGDHQDGRVGDRKLFWFGSAGRWWVFLPTRSICRHSAQFKLITSPIAARR